MEPEHLISEVNGERHSRPPLLPPRCERLRRVRDKTNFCSAREPLLVLFWLYCRQVPLVVSILISSDFLQMRRLVGECLAFVGEHLAEIVKLPIDLSCLSEKMVLQLAKVTS